MTAPSLSLPAVALEPLRHQLLRRRHVLEQLPRRAGAVIALPGVVLLSEIVNASQRVFLDPGVLLAAAVVLAAALNGLRAGLIAAAAAVAYGLLFYTRPAAVAVDGNALRVLAFAASVPAVAVVVGRLRDRVRAATPGAQSLSTAAGALRELSDELARTQPEALPRLIVSRVSHVVGADMVVLTIADRRTERQVVRAVHGTSRAVVGVEVLPGIGIAGQALRDQQTIVVGGPRPGLVPRARALRERVVGVLDAVPRARQAAPPRVAPAMALPLRHAGSVVATLTLGRADPQWPFSDDDQRLVELLAPQLALAVANGLLRGQLREASLRDALTGLYNRSYLDAALDQLLARRRRMAADERPPLSLMQMAVDGLDELSRQHGARVADQVVRAVATLLRQRFRQSDTIARVDADAFVVVMDGADLDNAAEVAKHIRERVREMALVDEHGGRLSVSVSAGCATFVDASLRSEDLLRAVAAALDTARWSGPGAVVAI